MESTDFVEKTPEELAEMSKNQIKRYKKNLKTWKESQGISEPTDAPAAEEKKDADKGKGGKKKKGNKMAEKIRKEREAKMLADAEFKKQEEEYQKKFEEDEKIRLEKEKIEKEENDKKREANRQKKKEEREIEKKLKQEESRRNNMIKLGLDPDSLTDQAKLTGKKTVGTSKKKDKKRQQKAQEAQATKVEEETQEAKPEEVAEVEKEKAKEEKADVNSDDDTKSDSGSDLGAFGEESSDEGEPEAVEQKDEQKKTKKKKGKKGGRKDMGNIFENVLLQDPEESKVVHDIDIAPQVDTKIDGSTKLRCPIICIMGHVDTGKTKLLDKIRNTNVQGGEAGGITQQIGATYFPKDALEGQINKLGGKKLDIGKIRIPGLLIIDTPGHESFTNLRSRGSSLCDMAILVVDLMHGIEPQTLESIDLLRQKNTPFIIALNKVDRIYEWKDKEYNPIRKSLQMQQKHAKDEFEERKAQTILAFAEEGINTELYWLNEDLEDTYSMVPTSAHTGEGIPDLIGNLVKFNQGHLIQKVVSKPDLFECTVLEVKVIEGHGHTIDIILVNGCLEVGDTIVLSGFNGPIVTKIRALLTPFPMKEMRVKGEYQHHDTIHGAMGIKVSAPELEHCIAGSELHKAVDEDDIDECIEMVNSDIINIVSKYVDKNAEGVCVQASTLGSLEALLEFLKKMGIPVCSVNIGPIHKKDVMKALKWLIGDETKKEYATILAFDVKIMKEAEEFAEENHIKVFRADIIYHLFDSFKEYVEICETERKSSEGKKAVFPVLCQMIPDHIFNRKDPILIGVEIKQGILKIGTPLCVPEKDFLRLGVVAGIKVGKNDVESARAEDGQVSVKIAGEENIEANRHFTHENQICSIVTRKSIDLLKKFFKKDLVQDDLKLLVKMKKVFDIL